MRDPEDFGGCGELGPDLLLHAEGEIEDARDALRARLHVAGCRPCGEWVARHEARTRSLLETFDDRSSRERRRSVERILGGVRALSAANLASREPGRTAQRHPGKEPEASRPRPLRHAALAAAASLLIAVLVLVGPPPGPAPDAPAMAGAAAVPQAEAASGDPRTDRELIPGGIRWLLGTVRESEPIVSLPEGERIRLVGLRPSGLLEEAPARLVEAVRGSRPGLERCFVISTGQSSRREAIEIIPKAWYDIESGAADPIGPGSRECRVIIVRDADPAGPVLHVFTLDEAADLDADPSGYAPGWLRPPRSRRASEKDLPLVPATWQP